MAHGSPDEQAAEAKLAMTAEEVVVDISALFTLKMLNMLPLLPQVFKKVVVATATFESVRAGGRERLLLLKRHKTFLDTKKGASC